MVIVISRDAKDVPESEALDNVLGYTAANDVSRYFTDESEPVVFHQAI